MTAIDLNIPAPRSASPAVSELADAGTRIAAGLFLVPHGAQKLFGWFGGYGLDGTAQFFGEQLGMPFPYLAALGAGSVEVFAGLALALGLGTRFAAAAIFGLLAVAVTVHLPNGFFWTNGGWEYPVLWAVIALAYVIKGGGRYSLDRLIARR